MGITFGQIKGIGNSAKASLGNMAATAANAAKASIHKGTTSLGKIAAREAYFGSTILAAGVENAGVGIGVGMNRLGRGIADVGSSIAFGGLGAADMIKSNPRTAMGILTGVGAAGAIGAAAALRGRDD